MKSEESISLYGYLILHSSLFTILSKKELCLFISSYTLQKNFLSRYSFNI